jgi:hypothetical protein
MHPASRGGALATTPKSVATRNDRPANVCERVRARVEDVRRALVKTAPHGFQCRVASVMGWRKERPTREKSGVEKLSVELVLAEVAMHEEEGRPDDATRVLAAFQRKQTPVIRLRDGQYLLEFE